MDEDGTAGQTSNSHPSADVGQGPFDSLHIFDRFATVTNEIPSAPDVKTQKPQPNRKWRVDQKRRQSILQEIHHYLSNETRAADREAYRRFSGSKSLISVERVKELLHSYKNSSSDDGVLRRQKITFVERAMQAFELFLPLDVDAPTTSVYWTCVYRIFTEFPEKVRWCRVSCIEPLSHGPSLSLLLSSPRTLVFLSTKVSGAISINVRYFCFAMMCLDHFVLL